MMYIIDSSCWLEYFAGSEVGDKISCYIEDVSNLLIPSITIYEVFKKILHELDVDKAIFAAAHMKQGKVIDLDSDLAIFAAQIGKDNKLPLADSIIYAAAKRFSATLITEDTHFHGLDQVEYYEKQY